MMLYLRSNLLNHQIKCFIFHFWLFLPCRSRAPVNLHVSGKKRGRDCFAPFAANGTVGDGRRSSCPSLHSAGGHFSPPHLRLSFLLALPLPISTSVDVIFYYECVTEFCLLGYISETIFLWIYSLLSFCSSPLTQSTLPSFVCLCL